MLQKIWNLFCSLKLAIVLASAATLLTMGGSLVMHFHPRIFGGMDRMSLGQWFSTSGASNPELTWWIYLVATLVLLLGLNTLCCFADWLLRLRARWRKTGEYLIHLGFVLVLAAFVWGSLAGSRSEGNRLFVGDTVEVPSLPGHSLRLESFEPLFAESGRPIDMLNTVSLLRGEDIVARQVVKTNFPLTYRGLAVLPASLGRAAVGFRFLMPGTGTVSLSAGSSLELPGGGSLRVLTFFPQAARLPDGAVVSGGESPTNPALELDLQVPGHPPWRGWYVLREGLPFPLVEAGVRLWPTDPLYRTYSVLTVNRDPGAGVALAGGIAMMAGVVLAMVSFYYKRARGDRPDVR